MSRISGGGITGAIMEAIHHKDLSQNLKMRQRKMQVHNTGSQGTPGPDSIISIPSPSMATMGTQPSFPHI